MTFINIFNYQANTTVSTNSAKNSLTSKPVSHSAAPPGPETLPNSVPPTKVVKHLPPPVSKLCWITGLMGLMLTGSFRIMLLKGRIICCF